MNVENIQKLIEHLKTVPEKNFNINTWLNTSVDKGDANIRAGYYTQGAILSRPYQFQKYYKEHHTCGTVGCIAGHALVLAAMEGKLQGIVKKKNGLVASVQHNAREYLGLNYQESEKLFMAFGVMTYMVTPAIAIKVLEDLLVFGNVSWRRAVPEVMRETDDIEPGV